MSSLTHSLFKTLAPHIRLTRHEDSRPVERVAVALPSDGSALRLTFAGAEWSARLAVRPVPGLDGVADLQLSVVVESGAARAIAVALVFNDHAWSRDHYALMPAALYAGNRFPSRQIWYPPLLQDPADCGPDSPHIISDVPRLNDGPGPSRVQLLAGDLATPALAVHDPVSRRGWMVFTEQATSLGQTGLELEENAGRTSATFSLSAPGMREEWAYFITHMRHRPSPDRGADLGTGGAVVLRARVHLFPCADIPALLDRFVTHRAGLQTPAVPPSTLPFSAAWRLLEQKHNRDNWDEALGIYAANTHTPDRTTGWQMGWIGGMMVTWPLLVLGDAASRARALRNFDFVFPGGISRSGFFEGLWADGRWGDDSFGKSPLPSRRWHLLRKSADGLVFLSRQLEWLETRPGGEPVPAAWRDGLRACADAFVRLWRRHGQLGQFVDLETGELLVGRSASAGAAPAGLALAARLLGEPAWLDAAREIAVYYYDNYTRRGFSNGGPGEILQCPDSESAAGLLESFVVLHELTGEPEWLPRALDAARLLATWVMSYDFHFPPASTFGALDMRTTGTVFASVQNKHSSPGLCTFSGDSLLKLFRATGEPFCLALARDIARTLPQYLSRPDRLIRSPQGVHPSGWMCERVNTSDWLEPVGEIFHGSCWCEVSLMLSILELPGVYAQPDTGVLCAFDHVDARWLPADPAEPGVASLELTNPTAHAAEVSVWSETAAEARTLPPRRAEGGRRLALAPGASLRVRLPLAPATAPAATFASAAR